MNIAVVDKSIVGELVARPSTLTTEQRMNWLCDMHTLHYGVRFLYAVSEYHLYITYDGDDIREYVAEEDEPAAGSMDAAWGLVIDRAAASWAAEVQPHGASRPPWRLRDSTPPEPTP